MLSFKSYISIWPDSSTIWVCKYRQQGVISLCVCVWERLTRCGNRSYPSTGKTLGTTWVLGDREGDRPREGGGGGVFQGKEETRGEHPRLFILTTKPLPLPLPHSPPPTSVKCPSSTIRALQRGTTTNSASLTSHGKHSCLSAFCCPLTPDIPHQTWDRVLGQRVCQRRANLCVLVQFFLQTVWKLLL